MLNTETIVSTTFAGHRLGNGICNADEFYVWLVDPKTNQKYRKLVNPDGLANLQRELSRHIVKGNIEKGHSAKANQLILLYSLSQRSSGPFNPSDLSGYPVIVPATDAKDNKLSYAIPLATVLSISAACYGWERFHGVTPDDIQNLFGKLTYQRLVSMAESAGIETLLQSGAQPQSHLN